MEDEGDALITRVEFELRHSETNEAALASISGEAGLLAGALYQADTLVIAPASSYIGRVEFYDALGSSATAKMRSEAENYQLFYSLTAVDGVSLEITDVESDYGQNEFGADLRVGLVFEIEVAEGVLFDSGQLRLRVGDFGPGMKNGITLTVEPIVDIVVPVRVEIPPAPPPDPSEPESITQVALTLVRMDGTETWTVNAVGLAGLVFDNYDEPNNLDIEGCNVDGSGVSTCSESDRITLTPGLYAGQWTLSDFETGQDYTEEIRTEGDRHQFYYQTNFGSSSFTIQDHDVNGLPIGLSFELSVPGDVIIGSGSIRVRLGHFTSAQGDTKGGSGTGLVQDLRFRIPMVLHQTGPPETITRTVLTLHRSDDMEDITVTATDSNLNLAGGAHSASLVVETCAGMTGQQVCTSGDKLEFLRESTYTGVIRVYNDVTGENVMQRILDQGIWHQFFYVTSLELTSTITDMDANGNPVGFQFQVVTSSTQGLAEFLIILSHYGRFGFKNGLIGWDNEMYFSVLATIR